MPRARLSPRFVRRADALLVTNALRRAEQVRAAVPAIVIGTLVEGDGMELTIVNEQVAIAASVDATGLFLQ